MHLVPVLVKVGVGDSLKLRHEANKADAVRALGREGEGGHYVCEMGGLGGWWVGV